MQDGRVETRVYAHEGKVRIQVVDNDNAVEMEGDVEMAKHMIESLQLAIKEIRHE